MDRTRRTISQLSGLLDDMRDRLPDSIRKGGLYQLVPAYDGKRGWTLPVLERAAPRPFYRRKGVMIGVALGAAATGSALALWQWMKGGKSAPPPTPLVRDAGPETQEGISHRDWDVVDEQSDESFPASDPPGNY